MCQCKLFQCFLYLTKVFPHTFSKHTTSKCSNPVSLDVLGSEEVSIGNVSVKLKKAFHPELVPVKYGKKLVLRVLHLGLEINLLTTVWIV